MANIKPKKRRKKPSEFLDITTDDYIEASIEKGEVLDLHFQSKNGFILHFLGYMVSEITFCWHVLRGMDRQYVKYKECSIYVHSCEKTTLVTFSFEKADQYIMFIGQSKGISVEIQGLKVTGLDNLYHFEEIIKNFAEECMPEIFETVNLIPTALIKEKIELARSLLAEQT